MCHILLYAADQQESEEEQGKCFVLCMLSLSSAVTTIPSEAVHHHWTTQLWFCCFL